MVYTKFNLYNAAKVNFKKSWSTPTKELRIVLILIVLIRKNVV